MTDEMVVVWERRRSRSRSRRYPWGGGGGRDRNGKKTDDRGRACLTAVETTMVMIDLATAAQTADTTAAAVVVVEVMIDCPSFPMKKKTQKIDCLSFLMKTTTKANA